MYKFSLTEKDIDEYVSLRLKYPFIMKNIRPLSIGLVGLLSFGGSYLINKDEYGQLLSTWWIMPVIVTALTIYFIRNVNFNTRISDEHKETIFGEREMRYDEKGIFIKDKTGEGTHDWASFNRWESSDNLYLLFINHNASHIIPKRIFEDNNKRNAFEKMLQLKVFERRDLRDGQYLDA